MKPSLIIFTISVILLAQQALTLQLSYSSNETICLLSSSPRGAPKTPSLIQSCEKGYDLFSDNYCYGPCDPGFDFYWPGESTWKVCLEICPDGGSVFWGDCQYPNAVPGINRVPYYTSRASCENIHGSCASKEDYSGRYIPWCSSPYRVYSYQCKAEERYRTKVLPKTKLGCEKGYEKVGELCYPECGKGEQRSGKNCFSIQCPAGYTNCGGFCSKGRSCQSSQAANLGEFLLAMQQQAEKNLISIDLSQLYCPK